MSRPTPPPPPPRPHATTPTRAAAADATRTATMTTSWYPIGSLTEPTGRADGLTPERHRRVLAALAALDAHRRRVLVESRSFVVGGGAR